MCPGVPDGRGVVSPEYAVDRRFFLPKIAKMAKKVAASSAKNNFGGLLEDVASLGRVDIVKHGRLVAIVLSPRAFENIAGEAPGRAPETAWGETHMIPPDRARAARMVRTPRGFDED